MNLEKHLKILMSLTLANLKTRYRNTFYGFIWVLLNPMLNYFAQAFAFTMIFKANFPNYSLYLLAGLVPWLFIVQSVEICTGIFVHNAFFLKNIPVNPLVLPLAQMIDNIINFVSVFLILILYFYFRGRIPFFVIPVVLLPIIFLFISTTSLSVMLAVVNVKYRDLKFVTSLFFTVLYFLTPICYSINIVPDHLKVFISNSPFYFLIRPFQELLMNGLTDLFFQYLQTSFWVSGVVTLMAMFFWNKMKRNIVFYA